LTALNQNRYDQLLRRVGDLKGPGSKVNDALTELFPMLDVENLPAELQLLAGSRLCMGTGLLGAGGATFFGTMLLRNNAGSGIIARLIEVNVVATAGSIVLGPTQNSDTPLGGEAFADTRIFGEGTALKIQGSNNNLVFGANFWTPRTDADNIYSWSPPSSIAVISPGNAFSVSNGAANVALRVNWLWLERQAQPSELNL